MNIKEQVPSRCWYYLLDWNDRDNWTLIMEQTGTKKLSDLTLDQFWTLFKSATSKDLVEVSAAYEATEKPRPAVLWFADQMERRLKENDHKGGWAKQSFEELYLLMKKEFTDILASWITSEKKDELKIVQDCTDLGNFAMMIADLHARKFGK